MTSSLDLEFAQAQERVKTLGKRPSNQQLLQLYALYKQAEQGDASDEDEPKGFNLVAGAKYQAWKELEGMSRQDAQQQYIRLVATLLQTLS